MTTTGTSSSPGASPVPGEWGAGSLRVRAATAGPNLGRMRAEYAAAGLAEADLAPDWLDQLRAWLANATAAGLSEPNAMVLATADATGAPSTRTVLLKQLDERGLVFYTNYGSRKGTELAANPRASAVFPWYPIGRQVVVAGQTHQVPRAQTEAYFATRPRESQLGAWASPQSAVVGSRADLDADLAAVQVRFPAGAPVPAPPHWGGVRLVPESVEFWQGRGGRLHDRLRYRRERDRWLVERLAP